MGPEAVSRRSTDPGAVRTPEPRASASGVRGVGHGLHRDRVSGGADAGSGAAGVGAVVGGAGSAVAGRADGRSVGGARGGSAAPGHQAGEPPFGQPQHEHYRESQHQQRVPCGPHVRTPEPGAPRGDRASDRASRGGQDEPASPNSASAPRPAPVLALWATGAGHASFDPALITTYRCVLQMAERRRAPN